MTTIHQAAVARTQTAVTALDAASIKHAEASVKLNNLHGRQQKVAALVQKLEVSAKGDPKKYGTALADAKSKLTKLGRDISAQGEVMKGAGKALAASRAEVDTAATQALAIAKKEKMPAAVWVDSLEDAASLPVEKQKQVLGAAAYISKEQALATDVKTVKQALKTMNPDEALKVLDRTLMGTAPQEQAKLLAALKPELEFLARAANEPITYSSHGEASGKAYVEAMRMASPAAQKLMAKALAATFPDGDKWRPGLEHGWKTGAGKALGESMKSGQNFGVAGEVVTALTAAGKLDQAGTMRGVIADTITELRTDFEKQSKGVAGLRGELALLNQGVGSLMTTEQRNKAIEGFKAKHAEEFGAFDSAASKLTGAFEAFPLAKDPLSPDVGRWAWQDGKNLQAELGKVQKLMGSIQSTPAGEKAILDALRAQEKGVAPAWLDSVLETAKTSKDLTEGTAKVIATGIAQLGMMGTVTSKQSLVSLLQKNAGLLGIDAEKARALGDAFTSQNADRITAAFKDIDGGGFASSKKGQAALKVVGLGFAAYGVAKGIKGWDDAGALDRFKTVVAGAQLGVEGATLALEVLGRKTALQSLSKLSGGLNVVGGMLDVFGGIKGIADGSVGEGVADLMSGAGGVLMGLASVSSSVPGGQVLGAALAVGGLVTKLIVGSRAKAKAERNSEADARAYLEAAGVDPKLAGPLGNVREDDHRNAGVPISQLAERLGMKPEALFLKLQKLPADKLDEFVKRMLSLELDDSGRAVEGPVNRPGNRVDSVKVETKYLPMASKDAIEVPRLEYGPRSMSTATEWAKDFLAKNGL